MDRSTESRASPPPSFPEPKLPGIFRAAAYDYLLPPERIASEPPAEREAARLLIVGRQGGPFEDRGIPDLPDLLREGDLLVVNDTRVRKIRLRGVRAKTGGRCEALVLAEHGGTLRILLGTRGRPVPGEILEFGDGLLRLRLEAAQGDGVWTASHPLDSGGFDAALEAIGRVPLPPYIHRAEGRDPRDELDRERYQTVYARSPGAAAAPTAGLHLTPRLLDRMRGKGVEIATVTLHVGLGTFRPVSAEDLREHPMHAEDYEIPEETAELYARTRHRGGRIVAVGTTSVRVLESAAGDASSLRAGSGRTTLFLYPPATPGRVDALLTNFHAPRSTLLMLVSCFAGRDRILEAYRYALAGGYRFLSYGDAMFLY